MTTGTTVEANVPLLAEQRKHFSLCGCLQQTEEGSEMILVKVIDPMVLKLVAQLQIPRHTTEGTKVVPVPKE